MSRATEAGTRNAAPTPCSARAPIKDATLGAMPHRNEPSRNTPMPPRNTRFRPSRSPVRPPTTRRAPNTMEYAVIIHDSAAELAWGYDASMSGKATLTLSGDTLGASTWAAMSVSMNPTCTPTTNVPCGANSTRRLLVSDQAAALEAEYIAAGGIASHESTDRTFTMAPPPFAARTGAKARLTASGPNTLVSNSSRPPARASSASTPVPVEMPALLITSVTSWAKAAAAATSSGEVMSSATGTTPGTVMEPGSRAPP